MKYRRLLAFAAAAVVAAGAYAVSADETGSARVYVRDGWTAVEGATVELVQDGEVKYTGETAKESDAEPQPRKTFENVAPGTYTIRVRYEGRSEDEEKTITVEAGKRASETVFLESKGGAAGAGQIGFKLNPMPGYVVTLNEGVDHQSFVKRTGLPSDTYAFHTVGFNGQPQYALQTNMPRDMWQQWSSQYCNGNSGVDSCEEDHCDEWLFPAFQGPPGPRAVAPASVRHREASPVTGVDTDEIERAPTRDIGDILDKTPGVTDGPPVASLKGNVTIGGGAQLGESTVSLVPQEPPVQTAIDDNKDNDLAWDSGGYLRIPLNDKGRFRVSGFWTDTWRGNLTAGIDWSNYGYGDAFTPGGGTPGTDGVTGAQPDITGVVGHPFSLVAGFGWESEELVPPRNFRFSVGFRF